MDTLVLPKLLKRETKVEPNSDPIPDFDSTLVRLCFLFEVTKVVLNDIMHSYSLTLDHTFCKKIND